MRTRLAWGVLVAGSVVALLGLVVMVVLGPDSRFTSGPHEVDTDGVAVVTAPGVVSWKGLQVDVMAELPVQKPVFVGVGNSVDVENYVARTERLEVTSFRVPWTVRTREVEGRPALPGAPTALDWWIVDSAGLGGAAVTTTLPDETVSVAITSVGTSSNLSGLQVTFAYGVRGGFLKGLGLLLAGLGAAVPGWFVARGGRLQIFRDEGDDLPPTSGVEPLEVEEVVYVYVDEHGVEHEITAEEAEQLQAELDAEQPEPEPVPDPEPPVSGAEPPAPVAEPVPGAEPTADPTPPAQDVVYVFVDEDGVEHEVSADELDQYEIVDEEDER